jgi:hypothetical protein
MDEPFDTKVAIVLLEGLPVWQKANVTAFLVSGIAEGIEGLVGEAYIDGSGNRYLPKSWNVLSLVRTSEPAVVLS